MRRIPTMLLDLLREIDSRVHSDDRCKYSLALYFHLSLVKKACEDERSVEDLMRYVEFITSAWTLLSRVTTETMLDIGDWNADNLMAKFQA